MAKTKGPDLADYAVHLHGHHPLKIRATSLAVIDKWLFFRDAGGGLLFAAPEMNLHYVKLLEPAEELAPPERLPIPGFEPEPEPEPRAEVMAAAEQVTEASADLLARLEDDPEPAVDARGRKHGPGGRFAKA